MKRPVSPDCEHNSVTTEFQIASSFVSVIRDNFSTKPAPRQGRPPFHLASFPHRHYHDNGNYRPFPSEVRTAMTKPVGGMVQLFEEFKGRK